jgi:hypothetical protein
LVAFSFVIIIFPLRSDPLPQRRVLLVLGWHHTMANLLFELNELFMLLVPELVAFAVLVSFQSEPNFVQTFLSIKSKAVVDMNASLLADPLPLRCVRLALGWHHAMTIL